MGDPQHRLFEIDNDISLIQNAALTLPRADPRRIGHVQALAVARLWRYRLSGEEYDLNQSIIHHTEAILFPLPWDRHYSNIIQVFFSTTQALIHRADKSRQPEDIKRTINYLRYLRGQSPEAINLRPSNVAIMLVHALSRQVVLELQDIEEIADLCHELLNSKSPTVSPTDSIMPLVRVAEGQYSRRWEDQQEPSAKVINCLREANIRFPDSHEISIALAGSLLNRYRVTFSNDDHEEGTAILDRIISSNFLGDRQNQYQEIALMWIVSFAQVRSMAYGSPEHLEEGIYRLQTLLRRMSLGHPTRPNIVYVLSRLQDMHFTIFGLKEAPRRDGHYSKAGLPGDLSFLELNISLSFSNSSEALPMEMECQHGDPLKSFFTDRSTNIAEIEEAVKNCRIWFTSFPPGHHLAYIAGQELSVLLRRAFMCTNNIEYLNESITILREVLKMPHIIREHVP